MDRKTPRGEPDPATHEKVRIRRRAHWRIQRQGPDRTLVRRVRIKACFITVWRPRKPNYEFKFD